MKRQLLPIYTPRYIPNGKEMAVISTSKGFIRVKLDGKYAPITSGNFIELARRSFYDMLKFHAYKADSMIIGGCPYTRNLTPVQVEHAVDGKIGGINPGTGDARYAIKDEFVGKKYNHLKLGSICMYNNQKPQTGSCQFFFSLGVQPKLDDKYTVFGRVTDGIETVLSLRVGDVILGIEIKGADEVMLTNAVSCPTPTPGSVAALGAMKAVDGSFESEDLAS